jgi:hypothetical protein
MIFGLQRDIRGLEQEIKNLDSIVAAEAAEEAQKNSWGAWLLSPIYKKAEDSEEEKAGKDRERQERRIEKYMKEGRPKLKKADLKREESLLRKTKEEAEAADRVDNRKIRVIQDRILARETREKQEMERIEKERVARIEKQQLEQWEKLVQEVAEALIKKRAEERAAGQTQHAHLNRPERFFTAEASTRHASTLTCRHDGWWPEVQGRTTCPECYGSWTYLLQCPDCKMKACPKCRRAIRRRILHNTETMNQRASQTMRTPSPWFFYDYD